MSIRKVVICGAGFLGRHIARAIMNYPISDPSTTLQVQILSRHPKKLWESLRTDSSLLFRDRLLPAASVDITKPTTLKKACQDASTVVSLVGIMHGSPYDFETIQLKGAEAVAKVAKDVGAKLIHFSAIGADPNSKIPYVRTKGLAEDSILKIMPDSTIIRPSLVFGPEDDFFNRFERLSRFLPFLPVFDEGASLFQPVYAGDIANFVQHLSVTPNTTNRFDGKIIHAGGPEVFSYRELMQLVLDTTGRNRVILSLPSSIGMLQGAILEKLPVNLFTVTRDQVELLRSDNIVEHEMPLNNIPLQQALREFSAQSLRTIREIVPTYLH